MRLFEKGFCKGCGKAMANIPFIGEPTHTLEDGTYCQTCAKIKVDKKRKNL